MTPKATNHGSKEQFPNSLWWEPFYAWQKQVNDAMQCIYPFFMPAALWKVEEDIFCPFPQNICRALTPWWAGNNMESFFDTLYDKGLMAQAAKASAITGLASQKRQKKAR